MPAQAVALADVSVQFVRAAAVVGAATDTSTSIDLSTVGYEGVMQFVWTGGAITGTGDCSLEDSADNSSFAAVTTGIGPTPAQVTTANQVRSISVDVRNLRRYVRAKTIVGGTSWAFGVALVAQKKVTG